MKDECRITRDASLSYDDTLDENTGILVPPSPDSVLVYEGKCDIKTPRAGDYKAEIIGGEDVDEEPYKVLLPIHEATDVRYRDILEVKKSFRDPLLLGSRLRVLGVPKWTHKVYRAVFCQDVTHAF